MIEQEAGSKCVRLIFDVISPWWQTPHGVFPAKTDLWNVLQSTFLYVCISPDTDLVETKFAMQQF